MADNESERTQAPQRGFEAFKQHCIAKKLDVLLWTTRFCTMFFTFMYIIPIFGNPYNSYYKALFANGATSAIRLHQRLPAVSFTREYLTSLLLEDSFHYLLYSLIFLYVSPVTLTLLPIFLFSMIHFASYSLTLLDTLGQNSWWGARLLISLIEFQSRNILRLIAFSEIILMPFTVILILVGRAGLLTPFIYYHFLSMRYKSMRNPYTRNVFHELRVTTDALAAKPGTPTFISNVLRSIVDFIVKLSPARQQPAGAAQ
ncbi:hypothetical protein LSTR_LSTR009399 [Laodelphax striatellus]|uniref:Uncharacterized protein n=1 Tax=Laodelphax striatellus TaxID=195883 RepID=A0A482WHC5_LAOST|nr:hypothetical protein LSTR_LSTR009399 [Laodelphax striatellus]